METGQELESYIFDIQGFSVHDGPGCRSIVFFSGCPLSCKWCSNPEGITALPQILYSGQKCSSDYLCFESCHLNAIEMTRGGLSFIREFCLNCAERKCLTACNTGALRSSATMFSVGELFNRVQRDRQFWGAGGGVTLSGGEPLMHREFAVTFLRKCYEAYIHTAIETCGNVPWINIEQVLPYTDWFFYDLKNMDDEKHRWGTGAGNELILANALRLSESFRGRIIFRLPLIPGYNDSESNLEAVATFIKKAGRSELNLLPLHHLGREKYSLTGRDYWLEDIKAPDEGELRKVREFFNGIPGIECYIGSETPF